MTQAPAANIGWQVNNGMDAAEDFHPAVRHRRTNWRPDVVNLVLTTLDEKRALSTLSRDS
jgi:hypothetical protein